MDDSHILATDGRCVLSTKECNRCLNLLDSKLTSELKSSTGVYLGAVRLGCIENALVLGVNLISYDGVESKTCLLTKKLGSLKDGVVERGKLKNIGLGDVVTVLCYSSGDCGYSKALAIRGYTLGDGSSSLGKRRELTELNGLTAIGRDRSLLSELIVNEICGSLIDKSHIVEGLHFGGQTIKKSGLYLISEKLKVDFVVHHFFNLLFVFWF